MVPNEFQCLLCCYGANPYTPGSYSLSVLCCQVGSSARPQLMTSRPLVLQLASRAFPEVQVPASRDEILRRAPEHCGCGHAKKPGVPTYLHTCLIIARYCNIPFRREVSSQTVISLDRQDTNILNWGHSGSRYNLRGSCRNSLAYVVLGSVSTYR